MVWLGTEPRNEAAAVSAVLREIRRIRESPVGEAELREAIGYLAGSYVFRFETAGQMAAYLHEVQEYGLGVDYRERFLASLARVTRGDVLRAARSRLDPERFTLVAVGPPAPPAGERPARGETNRRRPE